MTNASIRKTVGVCALSLLLVVSGCHRHRKTTSAPKSDEYADKLKPVIESKHLQVLHWPNFSDYEPLVQTFYDDRNYEVAWVDDADNNPHPSPQATAFIHAFQDAAKKGLNPEEYDASRWPELTQKLATKNGDDVVNFDAAMTVSVMRYISDLRIGRINPTHFNFDIDADQKKYDLPEFVSDNAVDSKDVPKLISSVEPDSEQYRKLEDALGHYLDLARQQAASPDLQQPLPTVEKPISPGGTYAAADALEARLQLEGDMPGAPPTPDAAPAPTAPAPTAPAADTSRTAKVKASFDKTVGRVEAGVRSHTHRTATPAATSTKPAVPSPKPHSTVYSTNLSDGVKQFQANHGLTADGKLSPATLVELNVPLSARVQQIDDSLERWRWLPNVYVNAPLMVNLPEFVLRGYKPDHSLDFTMKVVVGKVVGDHDTPVFTHMMKYLIFRPFWNVPTSIVKKELTGHIQKSGIGYLASHNFETTDSAGHVVEASAAQVEHFNVNVREKPGPKNSLGLIKFMFPNEYDIYLHSTPQPELFNRSRRDFSHGCVRVQKPADLAVWVLNRGGVDDWDMDKVNDAMQNGPDNHQVNLKQQIPIVIFYLTANIGEDGRVHFFDDLYGYDKELNDVLAKGMPYPSGQQKVNPNPSPDGTD
jgi:murein L,D-transpeptidase YcbB/YkuD